MHFHFFAHIASLLDYSSVKDLDVSSIPSFFSYPFPFFLLFSLRLPPFPSPLPLPPAAARLRVQILSPACRHFAPVTACSWCLGRDCLFVATLASLFLNPSTNTALPGPCVTPLPPRSLSVNKGAMFLCIPLQSPRTHSLQARPGLALPRPLPKPRKHFLQKERSTMERCQGSQTPLRSSLSIMREYEL